MYMFGVNDIIMAQLRDLLISRLEMIDKYLGINDLCNNSIKKLLEPFTNSLNDNGALPYLVEEKRRYRASPLASALIWLDDSALLPFEVLDVLQNKLIDLRDNHEINDLDKGQQAKFEGDELGWSISEGVSIWSTSLSIIALFDKQGCGLKKVCKYKKSILWLVKQQNLTEKGWAYQNWDNCSVNVIMTSLALIAIALTMKPQNIVAFNFSDSEKKALNKSLDLGFEYLQETIINEKNYSYWQFNNGSYCVSTTWALVAIKNLAEVKNDEKIWKYFNNIKTHCLNYIINKMPNNIEKWKDEQIVCEAGAKYSKQKNYYSFTSTLLSQLFDLGISPYHPKVVMQIKWLLSNIDKWKIENYDKGRICTFTCAMNTSVIFKWIIMVGCNAKTLLQNNKDFYNKTHIFLYGYNSRMDQPYQIVLKRKIKFYVIITISVFLVVFGGPEIYKFIYSKVSEFLVWAIPTKNDFREIYIDIISAIIIAILTALPSLILKFIKGVKRWLTNRY